MKDNSVLVEFPKDKKRYLGQASHYTEPNRQNHVRRYLLMQG
jgi:hypothetical protein